MKQIKDRLEQALARKRSAEMEIANAEQELRDAECTMKIAMHLGDECPCRVAVLPDGTLAVHVWVEGSANPNQLHIVEPEFLDHDGKVRKKYIDERLGFGDG